MRDRSGQLVDLRVAQLAPRLHRAEQVALRELLHADGVLDGRDVGVQHRGLGAAADGDHIEVEVLGQALVEAHFLFAEMLAGLERGEV